MADSPDKPLDDHLDDFWPLGSEIPERYGADEILYYRPLTPISSSDDEEVSILPKRFGTAIAGTKRHRSASFEERRANMRRKMRQAEEERRLRQTKQIRKLPTHDPQATEDQMEDSSESDDSDDDGDDEDPGASLPVRGGGPKPNDPEGGTQTARIEACSQPTNQVEIPIGTASLVAPMSTMR